jgi:uncharacterized protein
MIFSGEAVLIFSQELVDEFLEVTKRLKFKKFFSHSNVELLLETIEAYASFIQVKSSINICRHFKDNFLLSLCVTKKSE